MQRLSVILIFLLLSACSSTRYNSIKKERSNYPGDHSIDSFDFKEQLDSFIENWMGTPYLYGGMSKGGVDCSGFSSLVFLHVFGKTIPRTAQDQFFRGKKINYSRVEKGDLVFFNLSPGRKIDHVGIYLGENQFAHATTSAGVIISNFTEKIYQDNLVGACRY